MGRVRGFGNPLGRSVACPAMPSARRLTIRTTAATAAAMACALTPVFLFGALSSQIADELGFSESAVGAAVTVFFTAAAVGAVPAGLVTERVGPSTAMRTGASMAGAASLAIGLLASAWWHAAALLAVAGLAVGLIDTGGARAFSEAVPDRRRGLAFGVKEGSVPAASMLAGAAVPVLGLTVGWRPTFALTLVLLVVVWVLLPATLGQARAAPPEPDRDRPSRSSLVLVAIGSATGTGAATAGTSFLVPGGVQAGLSPGVAGTLLAVASALGITTRLVAGHRADAADDDRLRIIAALLLLGAAGPVLLALGGAPMVILGGLVMIGAGWGWTGLVFHSAVRADPTAPAAAAGIVLTGLSAGGASGPLAFGFVAERAGYPTAWLLASAAMLVGAGAMLAAYRRAARASV